MRKALINNILETGDITIVNEDRQVIGKGIAVTNDTYLLVEFEKLCLVRNSKVILDDKEIDNLIGIFAELFKDKIVNIL